MYSPPQLRNFSGKIENFKLMLDSYLELVPDQPKTRTLISSVTDYNDKPSNSIYDWCRSTRIDWISPYELKLTGDIYTLKPNNL